MGSSVCLAGLDEWRGEMVLIERTLDGLKRGVAERLGSLREESNQGIRLKSSDKNLDYAANLPFLYTPLSTEALHLNQLCKPSQFRNPQTKRHFDLYSMRVGAMLHKRNSRLFTLALLFRVAGFLRVGGFRQKRR